MSFYLNYQLSNSKSFELTSSDFSTFENEHLQLEFLVENLDADFRYKVILKSKTAITLIDFFIETAVDYADSKGVFCNGFQSWTETKIFFNTEKIQAQSWLAKPFSKHYGDTTLFHYKNKKGVAHSWTYSYIKLPKRKAIFWGSLQETNGYTIFEHHANENKLIIKKDCKGKMVESQLDLLDIFYADSFEKMAFQNYFEAQQLKPIQAKPAIGWTSWYYYYTGISEKIILDNLEAFVQQNIPIDIFQIDDGWQQAVGDWLHINEKFPNGLKFISDKIHQHNIKAGLWLAPLACEHNSFIVKEKPHWILKDENGKFLRIGFNPLWSYWFYALDIYNEEVRAYLKEVFYTILHEWNFDLVKLDFLYGTALIARNGKSHGEIMHDAMQFLRECVGEKMILGCGVPLSAAVGTTEYCRIGPDIHLFWDFTTLRWLKTRERPSVLNAIHNTISRRQLSGKWFWNDPDVFILRRNKNKLSEDEKYSLLLSNLIAGHLIFTSDNIAEYDTEQLRLYKSIFPLMPIEDIQVNYQNDFYSIHFRINERYYLALINTSSDTKTYKLPDSLYFDNRTDELLKGNRRINIPKHASKCLLNVGYTPFAVAGSKGHFFSGTEIENIYLSGNKIEIDWKEELLLDTIAYIKVPLEYEVLTVNNSEQFKRINKKEFSIIEIERKNT
ncbi:MAG: alpha-galactosidase [Bacteroidetes bacterium]|nr:alpha-galactosidase [Bacteroidota bacterium]